MTTENLIINGVDHSAFNLEWAKRGGVLMMTTGNVLALMKVVEGNYFLIADFFKDDDIGWLKNSPPSHYLHGGEDLRMATPAECAEAGIEYIEPPMMWRDIESAPKNTWVIATDGFYVTEAFFTTSRNAWVMKGCGELSVTHWMTKPQPPKGE